MGGIFGVASKNSCVLDLFFGIDYHSHLGTRRGGMAVYDKQKGFDRAIHNIENSPFRTKFDKDVSELQGNLGIGCISDNEPQPLLVRSHLGNFAVDQRSYYFCRIHISTAHFKKMCTSVFEALLDQFFHIIDLADCRNCKISKMRAHKQWLWFVIRNTADSKISL